MVSLALLFPHNLIIHICTGGIPRFTVSTQPSYLISVQVVSLALLFPHNIIIDMCTGGIPRVTFSTQPHNSYLYRWYPSLYCFHTTSYLISVQVVSLALLFPHNLIIDICTGGIPRVTFSTQPHNSYLYRWYPSLYCFHTTSYLISVQVVSPRVTFSTQTSKLISVQVVSLALLFSTQPHNWYLYRWYPSRYFFPHNLLIDICTGGIPRVTFSTQPHNWYLYRWYPSSNFFHTTS